MHIANPNIWMSNLDTDKDITQKMEICQRKIKIHNEQFILKTEKLFGFVNGLLVDIFQKLNCRKYLGFVRKTALKIPTIL